MMMMSVNFLPFMNRGVYPQPTNRTTVTPTVPTTNNNSPVNNFYQNSSGNFWHSGTPGLPEMPTNNPFQQVGRNWMMPFFEPVRQFIPDSAWQLINRYFPQQRNNYNGGGYNPTPTPMPQPPAPPIPPSPTPNPNPPAPDPTNGWRLPSTDYRSLTTDQRISLTGLSATELGSLHVGGRGISFTGSREGIYQSYWTVLEKLEKGEAVSERDKAAVLSARQQDIQQGLPSGTSFERNYLTTLDKLTGSTHFTDKLRNAPPVVDTGKRLQVPTDINPASQQFIDFQRSIGNTNADFTTMMIMTNWNHDPLDNGVIDGSIPMHELASNSFGKALVNTPEGLQFAQSMAENELADGTVNNSSSKFFVQAFDSAYSNGTVPKVSIGQIQQDTQAQASRAGKTLQDVKNLVTKTVDSFAKGTFSGLGQGMSNFTDTLKNHPAAVAGQAGSMMLGAVCPYLASLPAMLGSRPSQRNFTTQGT